jgi:hypothetical protein
MKFRPFTITFIFWLYMVSSSFISNLSSLDLSSFFLGGFCGTLVMPIWFSNKAISIFLSLLGLSLLGLTALGFMEVLNINRSFFNGMSFGVFAGGVLSYFLYRPHSYFAGMMLAKVDGYLRFESYFQNKINLTEK